VYCTTCVGTLKGIVSCVVASCVCRHMFVFDVAIGHEPFHGRSSHMSFDTLRTCVSFHTIVSLIAFICLKIVDYIVCVVAVVVCCFIFTLSSCTEVALMIFLTSTRIWAKMCHRPNANASPVV
jgi:hypothetical protein